jgi:transposase InsO family protein
VWVSSTFRERLAQVNITQSMNRPGKITDNAFIEFLFSLDEG